MHTAANMIDLNKFVSTLARSGLIERLTGQHKDPARLSTSDRTAGKPLLKLGILAAVGGLCWRALRDYQQQQRFAGTSQDAGSWASLGRDRFIDLAEAAAPRAEKLLVFRAMIAAAMAAQDFDAAQQAKLFAKLKEALTTPADKASLLEELRHPLSISALANAARDEATAIEVYAASLLAVDGATPEVEDYLRQLAQALRLPAGLVHELHSSAETQRAAIHAA
jgi:uncharacterized membrane protein YebE (DUF533 family)